jgi:hypothetical protein
MTHLHSLAAAGPQKRKGTVCVDEKEGAKFIGLDWLLQLHFVDPSLMPPAARATRRLPRNNAAKR